MSENKCKNIYSIREGNVDNIYKPNTLANDGRKRIQYIDSRDDPFGASIVSILGLIESRDLVSQDGEDSIGGTARLKAGEERVRG